ncbi:hypothetical protein O5269_26750, partial [Escherichia coli]|nr:hypothetical protein [Escherichia coli]
SWLQLVIGVLDIVIAWIFLGATGTWLSWSESYARSVLEALDKDIFPYLGKRSVTDILPLEMLEILMVSGFLCVCVALVLYNDKLHHRLYL